MFGLFFQYNCNRKFNRGIDSLELSEPLKLIGRGSGRLCYEHSHETSLCVKIPRTKRGMNESQREYSYIRTIERLYGEDNSVHLTRFYGKICTTIGVGWVVEKVVDDDGISASPLISEYLTELTYAAEKELWHDAYNDFKTWWDSTAVVVRDLSVNNVCVKRLKDGRLRFVLVDGIGPKATLPRLIPLRWYARRRSRSHDALRQFSSMEDLVVFCQKRQDDQTYGRFHMVDIPTEDVRLLLEQQ